MVLRCWMVGCQVDGVGVGEFLSCVFFVVFFQLHIALPGIRRL